MINNKYKYICYGGYIIFFLSYILYFISLSEDLFQITAQNENVGSFVKDLNYKFHDAIREIIKKKKWFPMILIIIYTYVIPAFKLALGIICLLQPLLLKYLNSSIYIKHKNKESEFNLAGKRLKFTFKESLAYFFTIKLKSIDTIRFVSKFQLTDSFMAMIMFTILMDNYVILSIGRAGYYFWGYCLGTLISVQIISLCQMQISQNMIFNPNKSNYELDTDENDNYKRSRKLDVQIFISSFYIILVKVLFIIFYIHYFYSYSFNVNINLLDYRLSIISSALKGSDVLEKLGRSDYIVNGYLTTLLFVFILPLLHIICSTCIYLYFAYRFIRDANYKSQLLNTNKIESYKENIFQNLNFLNFVTRSEHYIANYDLLLYKYTKNSPKLLKVLSLVDHLGDWCMMEVYCLATLTAYFTLNGMPSINAVLPYEDQKSNLFFLLLLAVSGFLLTNNFSMFAIRIFKLHEKTFDEYNKIYNILNISDKNLDSESNAENENNLELKQKQGSSNSITVNNKKIMLFSRSYLPYFIHVCILLIIVILIFICTSLATTLVNIPRQELTLADVDDIIGHQVPVVNQYLRTLPFSIGNCDPNLNSEINTYREKCKAPAEAYEPTSDFESGMDPPVPSEPFSCQTMLNLFALESEKDITTPEALLSIDYVQSVPILGEITIIYRIYEIFGLSTAYLTHMDLDMLEDNRIRLSTRLMVPDFDIHSALNVLFIKDDGLNHCCFDTQYIDIEFALKCNGNNHENESKSFLYDLEIIKFDINEFYLFNKIDTPFEDESISLEESSIVNTALNIISGNKNLAPILNLFFPTLLTPLISSFELTMQGRSFKILDLVSVLIQMNTQKPYTCPLYKEENKIVDDSESNRLLKDLDFVISANSQQKFNFNLFKEDLKQLDYTNLFESFINVLMEYINVNSNQKLTSKDIESLINNFKSPRSKI